MRAFHRNIRAIYPFEEWCITETEFNPEYNHRSESIYALGNGYMGMRGIFEEGLPETVPSTPGIYVNGIYETSPIVYGEYMARQPQEYQTMINITDWRIIEVTAECEDFSLLTGTVEHYRRVLDLRRGILTREVTWKSPQGRRLELCFERFISQTHKHAAVMRCTVRPLNFSGRVTITARVQGRVHNYHHLRGQRTLDVVSTHAENESGCILSQTLHSGFQIGVGVSHKTWPVTAVQGRAEQEQLIFTAEYSLEQGESGSLEKYVAVTTSRETPAGDIAQFVLSHAQNLAQQGWDGLFAPHVEFMESYWADTDIQLEGDPALQQGLRFNAFHLLCSTGRDGLTNIAAKGLTGEYYEGHYFWDTETYIIPFFLYSQPDLVRKLLEYRYSILDAARENAARMKDKGALYTWRTINGHEASGNFLGSTVQYHINADIAYAIHKYLEATEDWEFLRDMGAEILFETARCWAARGAFIPAKGGRYCINEVCGPDEYKPGVNNNCYTNYMAKFNLELALRAREILEELYPQHYADLVKKLELEEIEFEQWQKCADLMYLPYDEELGIHPQDDSFLYKDPIDVDAIPPDEIPLVRNWHPLTIWRYQVIKQADVILLQFLLGDQFSLEEKKANYDYYEPKTTHDSSLSPSIYSIMAAEIGYHDHSYNYFMQTSRLDLDDYNKNAWQGVHTACMAGSWMCIVNGFAGMRTYGGSLRFRPTLPEKWTRYAFKVKFRGRQLEVCVEKDHTVYRLLAGEEMEIYHNGTPLTIAPGAAVSRRNNAH
ncbi:MAG: glycoside hydrolase family 65 protein [Limnochordia bacterium]